MTRYRFLRLTLALMMILPLWGCQKDVLDGGEDIPEGESLVDVSVTFQPLGTISSTKTEGKAIKDIKFMDLVIYSTRTGRMVLRQNYLAKDLSEVYVSSEGMNEIDGQPNSESKICQATLKVKIPYGTYRIYAVANVMDFENMDVSTEKKLKSILLEWNPDVISNRAIFGFLTPKGKENATEAPAIKISEKKSSLSAIVRRCVSKATVRYDCTDLNPYIDIYIQKEQIMDAARVCYLGYDTQITKESNLIRGDSILHSTQPQLKTWLYLNRGSVKGSDHSEDSSCLYFFENLQGKKEGKMTSASGVKDGVPMGTYLEVSGYYIKYKDEEKDVELARGPISYRFMLGKNTTDDFDAVRNCHYQITLSFKGDANNVDWHIDFKNEL